METRVGQTVAVLFDDGNGMVWNRGRVSRLCHRLKYVISPFFARVGGKRS